MAVMPAEVLLLGYPVRLGAEQQEHLYAVVREFQLMTLSDRHQRSPVPSRLLAMMEQITRAHARTNEQRDAALEQGVLTVDVRFPLSAANLALVQEYEQVLAEVDAFCHGDDLLVLARPPQVVALQRWVTSEFVRQADGREPTAWTGPV